MGPNGSSPGGGCCAGFSVIPARIGPASNDRLSGHVRTGVHHGRRPTGRCCGSRPTIGGVKAADITDEAFVDAIHTVETLRPRAMVSRWDVGYVLGGQRGYVEAVGAVEAADDRGTPTGPPAVYPPMPEPVIPEKIVLAKARKLIRRGVIDGCACGCRGDFEIPAPKPPDSGKTGATYDLLCLGCGNDKVISFGSAEERNRWAGKHRKRTGHDHFWAGMRLERGTIDLGVTS